MTQLFGQDSATNGNRRLRLLWVCLAAFFVAWTGWAYAQAHYPESVGSGTLRAGVRVLLWVIPAWLFVWATESKPALDALGLRERKLAGILWGISGFGVLFAINGLRYGTRVFALKVPGDAATWLNPILTAPLAEEILFRGVVFRVLTSRFRVVWALVLSSLLFTLIHVPYWMMAGNRTPAQSAVLLCTIFLLGVFFGFLFYGSKSLWAPLICHTLNNFFSIAAGL